MRRRSDFAVAVSVSETQSRVAAEFNASLLGGIIVPVWIIVNL